LRDSVFQRAHVLLNALFERIYLRGHRLLSRIQFRGCVPAKCQTPNRNQSQHDDGWQMPGSTAPTLVVFVAHSEPSPLDQSRSETPKPCFPENQLIPGQKCMCGTKKPPSRPVLRPAGNQLQLGELCISVEKGNAEQPGTSPSNLYPAVMWTWNFCWRNPLDF